MPCRRRAFTFARRGFQPGLAGRKEPPYMDWDNRLPHFPRQARGRLSENGARESRFSVPQSVDERREIGGKRRLEAQRTAVVGMAEREAERVQRLALERDRPQ